MKKANNAASQYLPGDAEMGYCSIRLGQAVPSFGIMAGRLNVGVSTLSGEVPSNVKVFLAEDYKFNMSDIYSSRVDTRNVQGAFFNIAITDQPSCESAMKNKENYACNYESACRDESSGGYKCWCPDNNLMLEGNPYIMDGCIQGLRLFFSLLSKCHIRSNSKHTNNL
jgi:hypothetical protein